MAEEIKKTEIDGVVVTIPPGEKAYLIAEVRRAFGKEKEIVPFEKIPIETRVIEALRKVGAGAEEITKRISAIMSRKKEQSKEVL